MTGNAGSGDHVVTVVIDVIRAFTTLPVLATRGVRDIVCVRNAAEARARRPQHQTSRPLHVGEHRDPPFPAVDLPNSPSAAATADVDGRDVVFFSANGTNALAEVPPGRALLAASLVNVGATAAWIVAHHPSVPVRIIVSEPGAVEDLACADHLTDLLHGKSPARDAARRAVLAGAEGHYRRWGHRLPSAFWQAFMADVRICAEPDSHPIPLVCERDSDGWLTVRHDARPVPTWRPA